MDISKLREAISYDPETGICTWKQRPLSHFKSAKKCHNWNARFVGKVVGLKFDTHNGKLYLKMLIDNQEYRLHRVIWAIVTGDIPLIIDHQDGNGLNNRWNNLRNVDAAGNRKNAKRRTGKDLPTGVQREGTKYRARISVNNRRINLGLYCDANDATAARKIAERQYGYHQNHDRVSEK